MRRILIAIAAVSAAALMATAAYAATTLNTYTAKVTTSGGTAKSSPAKPVPFGFTEHLTAMNATSGMRPGVLKSLTVKMSGVKTNFRDFKTVCTAAQIAAASNDAACPKAALVATGSIHSVLGDKTLVAQPTNVTCDPLLHVWNGGGGKLVFFFVITAAHPCTGLQTGAAAPYVGTIRQQGNEIVQKTPLPPDVSTNAGNIGLYGSLEMETLKWNKLTTTVNGKRVPFIESIGCKGSRPYSATFTAIGPNGVPSVTNTVTGAAKC